MAKAAPTAEGKRPVGLFGWCARILCGLTVLAITAIAALFAVYWFAYLPQQRAQAAAFERLEGSARRLAIYDAFVAQIDRHYYDQSFASFDWPKLRRTWRAKAALVPDDASLYSQVFLQVVQQFPVSHLSVLPPDAADAVRSRGPAKPSIDCASQVGGAQLVLLRRAQGMGAVVGEVRPSSVAARAGVTPGWSLQSMEISWRQDHYHFKGVFIPLTQTQMHALENASAVQRPGSVSGGQTILLRRAMEFDYRCSAPAEPFEVRHLRSGPVYIRFDAFQAPILKRVEAALKTAGDRGVVLDLRSNIGGFSLLGLNLLLPRLTPVFVERSSHERRVVRTDLWTWRYTGPLAVLVGPASASAAEITADALQGAHRAVIVGRRTNGSVLGSQTFPLPDGGQAQIPVVDIETLNGRRLEGMGVAPDVEVFPTMADVSEHRDVALERAVRALQNQRRESARG